MYLEHWNLREIPFSNVPDNRYFYESPSHRETLGRLSYLCLYQRGAGVLSGPFGSGKTLMVYTLFHSINREDHFRFAFIQNPRVSPLELLQLVSKNLGADAIPQSKSEALQTIEAQLHDNILDGRHTIIVIDEAHAIDRPETLEEIRLLLNLQLEDAYLLTLLLVGQPDLDAMVDRQKPLAQRISVVTHLQALTPEETQAYIVHRLQIAGRNETMFAPEALETIHRVSGGLPRRINHICDACLLEGFLSKAQRVDAQIALRATQTLRLTPQIEKVTQSPPGEINLPEILRFSHPPSHQPPTQI